MNDLKDFLSEWLVGMTLASIAFAAGFAIRLERSQTVDKSPNVLNLDIKSGARIGDEIDWRQFIDSLPFKVRRGEEDEPALAYRLMLLLGATIQGVELHDDGSLSINTTDGETLTVRGTESVWEESWILEEISEVARINIRSVTCNSNGEIFLS